MKAYYESAPRACLEAIMLIHPRLCLNGYDGSATEEIRREMLESHVEAFYHCCNVLSRADKTITFNRRHTSYGLKHILERAIGMYVANGIAIAALIATGYGITPADDVNVCFNIGERGYKALENLKLNELLRTT